MNEDDVVVRICEVGVHRYWCRLPDEPCSCGLCEWRAEAVHVVAPLLAKARADAAEKALAPVLALADEWAADWDGLPRANVCARLLRAAVASHQDAATSPDTESEGKP